MPGRGAAAGSGCRSSRPCCRSPRARRWRWPCRRRCEGLCDRPAPPRGSEPDPWKRVVRGRARMKGLLVTLVVLLGLAVVADWVAVGFAEDEVAQQLAAKGGLAGTPAVDIGGFPFLTQAIAGDYEDVRMSFTADDLGQPAGTR